jgi:putative transposase
MVGLYLMSVMEVEWSVVGWGVGGGSVGLDVLDGQLLDQLVGRVGERGVKLVGGGGLLAALTRWLLGSALVGGITDRLGYEWRGAGGDGSGSSRNGGCAGTVLTDIGPVEIGVPRDRAGSFEPEIVRRRRRLAGVGGMVLSLSARGLARGGISAHLAEVYGAGVSKTAVSSIAGRVIEGMAEW